MVFDRFGKKVVTVLAKMLLWCNLLSHWWFYYFCMVIINCKQQYKYCCNNMDTLFAIIALLSLVAFVVGMFNPSTVKCSTRGKVALIFASAFLVSCILGASFADKKQPAIEKQEEKQPQSNVLEQSELKGDIGSAESRSMSNVELKTLAKGDVITIPYSNKNIEITIKDIKASKIPGKRINLVLSLRMKNNSNAVFFVSDFGFKLLDAEMIEVQESGIFDRTFGDFMPGMFFFTIVDPNIGKEEQVGYSVEEGDYYLMIDGQLVGKIQVDL